MLPFLVENVTEGGVAFRLLPSGHLITVEAKGEIPETDWYLSKIDPTGTGAMSVRQPPVVVRNARTGQRLAMLRGLPARGGRVVALLEFGPAKVAYEALPGDRFTLKGVSNRHFVVDSVAQQATLMAAPLG